MMFAQLAEQLLRENQREKALEVLDFAEEQLPGYNVPYDYTSASMASMYFMLGEKEKAVAIMDKVAQNSVEYLRFAASLNREQKRVMDSTIGRESAILSYVLQICERNNENELVEKYYQDYANYAK
jgi:hypothetical protein